MPFFFEPNKTAVINFLSSNSYLALLAILTSKLLLKWIVRVNATSNLHRKVRLVFKKFGQLCIEYDYLTSIGLSYRTRLSRGLPSFNILI